VGALFYATHHTQIMKSPVVMEDVMEKTI